MNGAGDGTRVRKKKHSPKLTKCEALLKFERRGVRMQGLNFSNLYNFIGVYICKIVK